jgi:hypothetical protein
MHAIALVAALALLQYLVFAALVGRARGRYGVRGPAVTGHEMFERYYRVQMNTLELLIVLLPSLWLASQYWWPRGMAALGCVYLIGRQVYFRAYLRDPGSRNLGFMLSAIPTLVLLGAALVGAGLEVLRVAGLLPR